MTVIRPSPVINIFLSKGDYPLLFAADDTLVLLLQGDYEMKDPATVVRVHPEPDCQQKAVSTPPVTTLGFTLLELTIVLVIAGVLLGGILIGQDLIAAASVRATIGQIEKYNTAVNTFQGKFGAMPGDLSAAAASAFRLSSGNGAAGRGDHNGMIDGTVAKPAAWSQEAGFFWVQLSQAGLIDGSFSESLDGATPVAIVAASVATTFPAARLGRGNYINVGSAAGQNFYQIAGITGTSTTGAVSSYLGLTPTELYSMDTKLDDGSPLTGCVQARGGNGTASGATVSSITLFTDGTTSSATAASAFCTVGDTVGTATTNIYNLNAASKGDVPACIGRFRFE